MNSLTKLVVAPFVAVLVYYFCAILWSLIASLALCNFYTFPAMLLFWVEPSNVGVVMARVVCWFMAFGVGCSVFFMD